MKLHYYESILNFYCDSLTEEELLISEAQREEYASMTERGITIALDIRLTDALVEEGFIREIISKIQTMRKKADFQVTDHIVISLKGSERVAQILRENRGAICGDTLADDVIYGETDGFTMDWDVNGENVTFGIRVSSK